ncbi:titin, putative, partial [Ixodes scapularis]
SSRDFQIYNEGNRTTLKISEVFTDDAGTHSISCKVTGKPQPRVTWVHNDREVKENSDVWTTQRTDGYCELFISEAFPEDMGEYICKAVNVAGTATTRAHVHVE